MTMSSDPRKTFLSWYKRESQDEPSFAAQFSKKKKNVFLGISIACLALAALLAVSGARLFISEGSSAREDISLVVRGPESVTALQEQDYTLEYINRSHQPFSSLFIRLRYPESFLITDAAPSPSSEQKNIWNIGMLAPGQRGSIILRGMFTGTESTREQIAVFATAYPEKASAGIDISQSLFIEVQKNEHTLPIDGPREIPVRTPVTYRIPLSFGEFRSNPSLQIEIRAPNDFSISEMQPKRSKEGATWYAQDLVGVDTITVQGEYRDSAEGVQALEAHVSVEKNGKRITLANSSLSTSIISNSLGLALSVNNSQKDSRGTLGGNVPVSLLVSNMGKEDIEDLTLSVTFEGDVLDWSGLANIQNGIVKDGTITWTSQELSSLAILKSGAKAHVEFDAVLKSAETLKRIGTLTSESTTALLINAKVLAKKQHETLTASAFPIKLSLNSDTRLSHAITVRKEAEGTIYHVQVKIENSIHELESLVASLKLPDSVFWSNQSVVSAGTLDYMAEHHTVSWKLNRLPRSVPFVTYEFDLLHKGDDATTTLGEVLLQVDDVQTKSELTLRDTISIQ
ncbi:hypothetical protein HY620_03420 [Candidatus Uhrbacteria bacterium]|nr:hypothetical protein [Candidatus Uhrbacteria bacterium]